MSILKLVKSNAFSIAGAVVGVGAGWAYWYFIGCSSGGCAITSNPLNSSLYGGLMGFLVGQSLRPQSKAKTTTNE